MIQGAPLHDSFGAQDIKLFARQGYLLIHEFLSRSARESLLTRIEAFLAAGSGIKNVHWPGSVFGTFNGVELDRAFPNLKVMYDDTMLRELCRLVPTSLATIADRRVGISVNATAQGGRFQPHYDRHIMTAIMYLNDNYDGGEMVFYPRVRYWLGRRTGTIADKSQRLLDRCTRSPLYLDHIAKRVTVKPRAGDLLVFEGTKTYHAVTPVTGGATRLSMQFGYDFPGTTFDLSEYYGK